ncbi:MAG TPA: tRNA epoxyqueuosine(34) reductase QueG [Ktedonobacteraceae bacterium]|nr:tRNA epoxyqueuosine(34) reductase QueG [Ktedonobacteraceae bacterium]
MINTTTIKEYAYSLGFDMARITSAQGFAEAERVIKERIAEGLMDGLPWFTEERAAVSCHPDALLPEAQSIISLAMFYLTEQSDDQEGETPRGRVSRYAWGDDYHEVIKPKLQQFATWLREYARGEVSGDLETRIFVDTGRMVDRAVAQRAGLGWYGKNTNILTKGWGSWIFLAEIVTNLPLAVDTPIKASCGHCEICLHACPTQALPAPYVLDNTRCISYLTIELRGSIPLELRPLMGNLIFGCDICQQVCPVNQVVEKRLGFRANGAHSVAPLSAPTINRGATGARFNHLEGVRQREEFRPRVGIGSSPELIPLLSLTDEQFREQFRLSPIRRTKRRGLLRNVCVALGNSGDRQAVPALIGALHDDEPLVRGHAAWALGRLGGEQARQALQDALADERDEEVRKEIMCALGEFE